MHGVIRWRWLWSVFGISLLLVSGCVSGEAAGLFANHSGSQIYLAEVQSYGESELKPDYQATLADKIADQLRQKGLSVSAALDVTNESGRHDAIGTAGDQAALSEIHMDAIIHGHTFDRGYAAPKLAHYADQTLGRAYFHDEARIENWQKSNVPYRLGSKCQAEAERIAAARGAQMLLFVNIRDVDVRLKHSIFASHTDKDTRGKKLMTQLDYYIWDARSGRVYEGTSEIKKTAQLVNFGLGQSGKGMDIDVLVNVVMDAQAKKLADDLMKQGLPALRGGAS